ncbi:MAG TPA: hypothetical protein VFA75_12005 [Nevskia sp.]|nr:hypothetical protein [Nevskia sp.]
MSLRLTYVDEKSGAKRIMPRYKWAFWAFASGMILGFFIGVAAAS